MVIKVRNLLYKADELLAEAEGRPEAAPQEIRVSLQKGIAVLCAALLKQYDREIDGELPELFRRCLEINADLEAVAAEVEWLIGPGEPDDDTEELIDAANEIWDFMIAIFPPQITAEFT
jgi:hypothetical protein